MEIFLSVLKITGIVLLIVLIVALVLAALILLLPIHYKVRAAFDKDKQLFTANAKATWIAYMFHGEADVKNNKMSYYLKFLGRKKIDSESDTDDDDDYDYGDYEPGHDIYDEIASAPEKEKAADADIRNSEASEGKKEDAFEKSYGEAAAERIEDRPEEPAKDKSEEEEKEKKPSLRDRINGFLKKIKELAERPKRAVKNTRYTIRRLCGRIRAGDKKIRYFYELFTLDSSKEAMQYALKELKFLLWHCRPRKITGYLYIGREDPADTGALAGYLCTLKSVFGKHFFVKPDFEHDVLTGDFYMKGYIQLWAVGLVLLKCYYNKNLMRFWRRLKRGREM